MSWQEWNKKNKEKSLTPTYQETLKLFLNGYSIDHIAKYRNIREETVERQVIELITKSFLPVEKFVNKSTIDMIKLHKDKTLSEIKEEVPDSNWFEIKATLASINAKPER